MVRTLDIKDLGSRIITDGFSGLK